MEKVYSSFLTHESVPVDPAIVICDTYSEILLMRSIVISVPLQFKRLERAVYAPEFEEFFSHDTLWRN